MEERRCPLRKRLLVLLPMYIGKVLSKNPLGNKEWTGMVQGSEKGRRKK